jgi:hypothetical protein
MNTWEFCTGVIDNRDCWADAFDHCSFEIRIKQLQMGKLTALGRFSLCFSIFSFLCNVLPLYCLSFLDVRLLSIPLLYYSSFLLQYHVQYICSIKVRRVAIFILYVISYERKMEGITYDKRNMSVVIRDMNIPHRFTKSWWRPWWFRRVDFNLTTRNPRLIFSQWYVCYQLIDWWCH